MNKYIFIILIIGLKVFPSWAQLEPGKVVEIKQFENVEISDIMTDQFGVLWVTTFLQLQKFDGYEVTHFMVDNSDSLSLQSMIGISRIFQDSQDNIWISGFGDINRYNYKTGTFTGYSINSLNNPPDSISTQLSAIDLFYPCLGRM